VLAREFLGPPQFRRRKEYRRLHADCRQDREPRRQQ
jgi:hypothetical protein